MRHEKTQVCAFIEYQRCGLQDVASLGFDAAYVEMRQRSRAIHAVRQDQPRFFLFRVEQQAAILKQLFAVAPKLVDLSADGRLFGNHFQNSVAYNLDARAGLKGTWFRFVKNVLFKKALVE